MSIQELESIVRKNRNKITLDVGCGESPKGDVNIDLYSETKQHYFIGTIDSIKTEADMIADGCSLPFPDKTFDRVISHHVIEHTKSPFLFLKELVRVAKTDVEIKCPHRMSKLAKNPYHVSYLNIKWFREACKKLNARCYTECSMQPMGLFGIQFWLRPNEITVRIKVNKNDRTSKC